MSGRWGALVPIGALLGALAWWLPWVTHERGAAGLVLLGLGLGDFWKFTAEWRVGMLELERLAFFLPPPVAAMILALWVAGRRPPLDRWSDLLSISGFGLAGLLLPRAARGWVGEGFAPGILALWGGVAIGALVYLMVEIGRARNGWGPLLVFLALVILPAFDLPGYDPREFSFQFRLATVTAAVIGLVPIWARIPPFARRVAIVLLGLVAALAPAWAIWRSWLVLQSYYGGGARVGVGVVITVAGFAVAVIGGAAGNRRPRPATEPPSHPRTRVGPS